MPEQDDTQASSPTGTLGDPDLAGRPVTRFLDRPLWYWAEIAEAVGTPQTAGGPDVTGVSIDTRSLQDGDLFIALAGDPGPRFHTSSPGTRDGHEFLGAAQQAGAAGALVSQSAASSLPQLRVGDTLDGLWALGRCAATRHKGRRIAITGSSGKTTAKSFLAAALSANAQAGSLNNFWGVPLCLARTPVDAVHAVYEIGTNQEGEIGPLSELVQPDVAVLLNVHPAHLGNFPSLEALTKEKLSIANGLDSNSNLVCEYGVAANAGLETTAITFGESSGATVRLKDIEGDRVIYELPNRVLAAKVPGGGAHRALTLGAVVGTLLALNEDPERAAELPSSLVPLGRGSERLVEGANGEQWLLIDDSYNANPASMMAALALLEANATQSGRPGYAIIGEMLELGDQSESYHLGLLDACNALAGVFCVGRGSRVLYDALPDAKRLGYADEAKQIDLEALLGQLPAKGAMLIKGSNRVFWQSQFCARVEHALAGS